MLFRKLRTIFSHRDDRDYDGERRRDGYMDVLKQMQTTAPKEPSQETRDAAQNAHKAQAPGKHSEGRGGPKRR